MKLIHLIFPLLSDLVIIVRAIEFLYILLRYSLPCSEIYIIYFCGIFCKSPLLGLYVKLEGNKDYYILFTFVS